MFLGIEFNLDMTTLDYWTNGGFIDANYVAVNYWTPANYADPQT